MPRQKGHHERDRKEREADDGHSANRRFKKVKAPIFEIEDAVHVACHVDQNERHPGDARNCRDRRSNAQHDGCRGKRFFHLSGMGQGMFARHIEPKERGPK